MDTNFAAGLVFDDALVREIPDRELRLLARADVKAAIAERRPGRRRGPVARLRAGRSLVTSCNPGRIEPRQQPAGCRRNRALRVTSPDTVFARAQQRGRFRLACAAGG
jgi:hypothetical protein